MAFHQPTRQPMQRVIRPAVAERDAPRLEPAVPSVRNQDASQSWVLFAPTEATTASYLSETDQSLETPGRSRASDVGSQNAAPRWEQAVHSRRSASISILEDESVEDDGELDSLDSHLPEFRSLPGVYSQSQYDNQQAAPVFPGHDGLGSFRLDQPIIDSDAQDQIYQFERFNPRRVRRRRESLDLAQLELEQEDVQEAEKRQRIEAWRLEHSRVLLNEIQRETRRRRQSQTSLPRRPSSVAVPVAQLAAREVESDNMTWHDENAVEAPEDSEWFLTRITRKVMRDLMGIDARMVSLLLGETIPDEEDLSSTPRASQLGVQPPQPANSPTWQLDILERVSRELGMLVNQLSHHPGAFSTYAHVQQMPLPYGGLPIIPESNTPHAVADHASAETEHSSFPQFQPTMATTARPMAIPGRLAEPMAEAVQAPRNDIPMSDAFTQEEWEKDLDIKLVFRYLRSRFLSHGSNAPPSGTAHLATSSTQDTAAKVARVRQHHPLISRTRPVERRVFKATTPSSPVALRHASSCASQSTRRSARRSSVSSRHYWDIGGSLGTGSMVASNGPMGSWGEV
ncbi:hypothetical protein G7046_g7850 [Stylonectria norvegica]|nr:hypothetical protein G7046_g7850 [Stylonectria norvegica]